MKIVQSYSSRGWKLSGSFSGQSFGWLRKEYHYMSWALSCLQYRSVYGNVNLVTDSDGKLLLCDLLKLPYTSVSTELDDFKGHHEDLWNLTKCFVYSLQQEPFLHVDGDAFLWRRIPEETLACPLIVLNEERLPASFEFYQNAWREVETHFTYIPQHFEWTKANSTNIVSYNAGIIGANDLYFFKDYVQAVESFIENNLSMMAMVNDLGRFSVFAEQHMLYLWAKQAGIPVGVILPEEFLLTNASPVDVFVNVRDYPVLHPVSTFKRAPLICKIVEQTLRAQYPKYYYRIRKLLNDYAI